MSRAATRGGLLAAIDGYWRCAAPPERLACLRIIVGSFAAVYATVRIAHFASYARMAPAQFRPIGVVSLLSQPLPAWLTWSIAIATSLSGIAFVLGWRFRWLAPVFAALLLWITSYASSWGMIFHTENLMVLQVAVLALAPAADAYALDARNREARGLDGQRETRYGWPIRLLCAVTVVGYVIAGVAKLRLTGGDWVTTDFLRNYVAYDALRKVELGSLHSPLGAWLAERGAVFKPLAALSIAMELGAPMAMISRRLALVWVVSAVVFHVGVLAVMAILFPFVTFGFGFACFFRVERVAQRLISRWSARRVDEGA